MNTMTQDSQKIRVLFMQSQTYFGADSLIHSLFMRFLNHDRVQVYAAVNPGSDQEPSPAFEAISAIQNIQVRPTNFGITVNSRAKKEILLGSIKNGIPLVVSLANLGSYIRKNRIQIIHCTEKPRDAFYGFLLAKMTGAKLIVHIHVKFENWISPLTRFAMRHADGLIGVSDFTSKSITAGGYNSKKVYTVLNSLDASGWDYNIDGSLIRQEFGIGPQTPVLAIASRVFPWKGHRELVRALAIVKETIPDFKLLLVGVDDKRATPGKGSFTYELKKLILDVGLNEHVIFTGFRKDIAQILAASDIYAMPTFEEPFGVVFLEAMAMKKPVIALDNGGVPEIIEQGKSGLLSPVGDINKLAENIITLVKNPELQKQMGEHGRMQVEQYFTPTRMSNDLEEVYRKILGVPLSVPYSQEFVK